MLFDKYADKIKEVTLGDGKVSIPQFVSVCRYGAKVTFAPSYEKRVRESRAALESRLSEKTPIYGVNTGFGGNIGFSISDDDLVCLQENIIFSHACAMGQPLKAEEVRGMLFMLLIAVGQGHSAVRFEIMELVRDFLNMNITPYVPHEGSVGGLSYATYASMTLLGYGRVIFNGDIISAKEAMNKCGLSPITLRPREGLGITTNMGTAIVPSALAVYDFAITVRHADISSVLAYEALRSTDRSLHPAIVELRNDPEMLETADWLRRALKGSEIMDGARTGKVQESISIRLIPHMLGAFKSMLKHTWEIVEREMNSVIDNPVFFSDGTAMMGSNFDSSYIAIYCDSVCVAAINLAKMLNTHMKRLVDSRHSGLYPYLVRNPGVNNGFMMVQYVTEGLSADIAQLSNPATAFYTSTSAGQEGPNPLSDNAAHKACIVAEKLSRITGMTIMAELQALDLIDEKPSHVTTAVYEEARKTVTFLMDDDMMYERVEAMDKLIKNHKLLNAAEKAMGRFSL